MEDAAASARRDGGAAAYYPSNAVLAGDTAQLAQVGRTSAYAGLRHLVSSWLSATVAFSRRFHLVASALIASGLLLGGLVFNGVFNLFGVQVDPGSSGPDAAGDIALTGHMAELLIIALLFFFASVLLSVLAQLTVSSPPTALEHNYVQQLLYAYHAARARNIAAVVLVSLACVLQLVGVVIILWDVVCELPALVDNGWCQVVLNVPLIAVGGLLCVGGLLWTVSAAVPRVDFRVFAQSNTLGDAFQAHARIVPWWIYRGHRWPVDVADAVADAADRSGSDPPHRPRRSRGGACRDVVGLIEGLFYSLPYSLFDWLAHLLVVLLALAVPLWFPPGVEREMRLPGVPTPLRLTTVARLREQERGAYESGIALCNRRDCRRFMSGRDLVWHAPGSDFDLHPHCLPLDEGGVDGDAIVRRSVLPKSGRSAIQAQQARRRLPPLPPPPRVPRVAPRPPRLTVPLNSDWEGRVGGGAAATTEQVTPEVSIHWNEESVEEVGRMVRGVRVWDVPPKPQQSRPTV